MSNLEMLVLKAKRLSENTPDGIIVDGDIILCDIMQNADFEITGIAADIFNIWLASSDRESVERLFYNLTDVSFEEFVDMCIQKTTKEEGKV